MTPLPGFSQSTITESRAISMICVDSLRFIQNQSLVWDYLHFVVVLRAFSFTWGVKAHAVVQCEARAATVLAGRPSDGREVKRAPSFPGGGGTCNECVSVGATKLEVIEVHIPRH